MFMALSITVPSMVCQGCADTVTNAIKTSDPKAGVNVDLATKQVTVDTSTSEANVKQAIEATGHTIS